MMKKKMLEKLLALTILGVSGDSLKNAYYDETLHNGSQIFSEMTAGTDSTSYHPFDTPFDIEELAAKTRIYSDYYEHKDLVDKWIKLWTFPQNKVAIIDSRNLNIMDTIPYTPDWHRIYNHKWPKWKYPYRMRVIGRDSSLAEAFNRYDKYKGLINNIFSKRKAPRELTLDIVVESNVSLADSWAAAAWWQLRKTSKGDLTVNKIVDERKSIVRSTERAADMFSSYNGLFGDYTLAATSYIRGEYGVADDLEKLFDCRMPGIFFDSYSNLIMFHSSKNHKLMSKDDFWNKTKKYLSGKPRMFTAFSWNYAHDHRYDTDSPAGLYEAYLEDAKGNNPDYIRSFWDYYDINIDPRDAYWKYHEWLKGTKNNFQTPQYLPQVIALWIIYDTMDRQFKPTPLNIVEFNPTKEDIKALYSDPEFRELNMHIKPEYLKKGIIPPNARVYKAVD